MKNLIVIPLIAICLITQAQIINEIGEVQMKSGEVESGFLNFDYNNEQSVELTSNSTTTQVGVDDIALIKLKAGDIYYSKNVDGTSLLLKLIIQSKLSLYQYEKGEVTFYVEKGNRLHQLTNEVVVKEIEGKKYDVESNKYISILSALTSDKEGNQDKLDGLKLRENDLIELVLWYNGESVEYYQEPKSKFGHEGYVYYSHISSSWKDKEEPYTTPGAFGLGYQFYFNKKKALSVRIGYDCSIYNMDYQVFYPATSSYRNIERKEIYHMLTLSVLYDFYRGEKLDLYGVFRPFSWGYLQSSGQNQSYDGTFRRVRSYDLGIGGKYKLIDDFSIYAEINRLHDVKSLPGNFTFGINYEF